MSRCIRHRCNFRHQSQLRGCSWLRMGQYTLRLRSHRRYRHRLHHSCTLHCKCNPRQDRCRCHLQFGLSLSDWSYMRLSPYTRWWYPVRCSRTLFRGMYMIHRLALRTGRSCKRLHRYTLRWVPWLVFRRCRGHRSSIPVPRLQVHLHHLWVGIGFWLHLGTSFSKRTRIRLLGTYHWVLLVLRRTGCPWCHRRWGRLM